MNGLYTYKGIGRRDGVGWVVEEGGGMDGGEEGGVGGRGGWAAGSRFQLPTGLLGVL